MKTLIALSSLALLLFIAGCGRSSSSHEGHEDAASATAEVYTCPMHPQVTSPTPGQCPICGMDLVKASNSARTDDAMAGSMVSLTERDQILANVATVLVRAENVARRVRAFGSMEISESGKSVVSARFNGRIERLYVDAVGATVKAGQPLFDVYSPDLIQAQSEYLQALRDQSSSGAANRSTGRAKLLLLGLTEDQVKDLEGLASAPLVLTYRSPVKGTVTQKNIVAGDYINEGTSLYEVSDLATLWNISEVYESDARMIKKGDRAIIKLSPSDETISATVELVYPVVNAQTRTVNVRARVSNADGRLRPKAFTETVFSLPAKRSLTIPVSAVLVTGKRNIVYVKSEEENHFEAREVQLGARFDGSYEILGGLDEGEIVVSQGGYLIDSESQLRTGSGGSHQHGSSTEVEASRTPSETHNH